MSTCIEDFELDPFCYVGLSFSTHGTFALWGQLPPPSLVPRVLCGIDCQSGMRVHRTVPTRMWELRSTSCDGDCHVHAYAYARACTCSCLVAAQILSKIPKCTFAEVSQECYPYGRGRGRAAPAGPRTSRLFTPRLKILKVICQIGLRSLKLLHPWPSL